MRANKEMTVFDENNLIIKRVLYADPMDCLTDEAALANTKFDYIVRDVSQYANIPMSRDELITFEHEGKFFSMTEEAMDAAYRVMEMKHLREDAERQVEIFLYGCEKDCLPDEEVASAAAEFAANFHVTEADLKNHIDDIVSAFFMKMDCGVPENETWADAIDATILALENA